MTNDGIQTEGHQNSESNYSQGLGESFSLTQIANPASQKKHRHKGSIEASPNRLHVREQSSNFEEMKGALRNELM